MRKELDDALVRDFPNLYKDRYASPKTTCMCWGFPGDGWEPLIRRLSEKLEEAILKIPKGKRPCASQVKEKFGTLRFYMTSETDEMWEWIRTAEAQSAKTCEECGAPGQVRSVKWWLSCACEEHSK